MLHTIYFKQNKLIVADTVPEALLQTQLSSTTKVYNPAGKQDIKEAILQVDKGTLTNAVLVSPDPDGVMAEIKSRFLFIQAAGGIVRTEKNNILLIFRNGKWDLPKGKLDAGENLSECAMREVMEETGLKNISITQPLCTTYHTYFQDGQHCIKESHWYLMHATQTEDLTPQLEEGIEQCIWAEPARIDVYLANTHPSIADVLQQAMPLLK